MKVTFVILHYLTFEDTRECIDSIISNVDYNDYNIVVVDNGSPNDSGEMLEQTFKGISKVFIKKSKENLGFAKGNNLGYRYAKDQLGADFVILINNDTIIKQKSFLSDLLARYNKSKFHILGPDIVSTKDGLHQNPQLLEEIDESEIRKMILRIKTKIFLNRIGCEDLIMNTYFSLKGENNNNKYYNNANWESELEDIQLHGSCLILSPDFVNNYNGLYDNTFMYMEEHILFYIANKENLKVVYYPKIQILHKEDSSTDALFNRPKKKRLFVYKNMVNSLKELSKIQKNNKVYIDNMKSV
ncbi:glycosyltransferase family 2 protein [Bacillus sp. Au-Bac7]|uniref:glycosyltransferase family 2 protein n=1 Tax=Bacillus sp. Au-Bac7 TaxID=2906458 RepID=UPI001E2B70B8|nr:glycosyltransferase [Bacillus sp. Au-Bac7]MCE4049558.1 glycosyltransferase [Bacillus sp. Au-Bac7]